MVKFIYLEKRHPSLTPDEFVRRWRLHGARGMATPMWRHANGYVQAEPIRPVRIDGASDEYDGVALWEVNDDIFAEPLTPEEATVGELQLKDEQETFAVASYAVCLWTREEALKVGELGGKTAFLFFKDLAAGREAGEDFLQADRLNRLILDVADDSFLGADANTLPYRAVLEVSAHTVPDLVAILGSKRAASRKADLMVVTRECVLWDRDPA